MESKVLMTPFKLKNLPFRNLRSYKLLSPRTLSLTKCDRLVYVK